MPTAGAGSLVCHLNTRGYKLSTHCSPGPTAGAFPVGLLAQPCLIYVGSETMMKRSWGVLWHSGVWGEVVNAHGRI